ncbi:MAG: DUF3343 domain-containing protein [Oscillospiraceae bacterium]|jgi:hypothetical protein
MPDGFFLMAFDSTSHCMQTEKLSVGKYRATIVPTPTEITSGCGFSLRFFEGSEAELTSFLHSTHLPAKLYHMGPRGPEGLRSVRLVADSEGGAAL